MSDIAVIVTGASGRLGQIMARTLCNGAAKGLRFWWSSRVPGPGPPDNRILWQIDSPLPAPDWPPGAILLHLAGTTGDDRAGVNPALIPPLLAACRKNRVRHLVFASSIAVYGQGTSPRRETDPPCPATAYGRAKHAAEQLLTAAQTVPLTLLRLGNVAGADALLGAKPGMAARVIRLDPVPGNGPEAARGPLRSWLGPVTFAHSLVAILQIIAAGHALPPVLNLAQAPPLGMAELLAASGLRWEWAGPDPAVNPAATLDTTLLQSILPLSPAHPAKIIAEIASLNPIYGNRPVS